jgi:hypothetical protein
MPVQKNKKSFLKEFQTYQGNLLKNYTPDKSVLTDRKFAFSLISLNSVPSNTAQGKV